MRTIGLAFTMAALLGFTSPSRAQVPPPEEDPEPWSDTAFVIIKSTPSYREAAAQARAAARELGVKLDLRGLIPHRALGLTFRREVCEEDGSYPCYWPRGREDDGVYVSIEHTGAYDDFAGEQYIVVLASGPRGSAEIGEALRKARRKYPDAYLKVSKMYLGCGA